MSRSRLTPLTFLLLSFWLPACPSLNIPTKYWQSSKSHQSTLFLTGGKSAFHQRLSELRDYRKQYGNCLVPKRYEDNPTLGNWVNKQRQLYRRFLKGEKSSLNKERIALLEEEGFVWVRKWAQTHVFCTYFQKISLFGTALTDSMKSYILLCV